MADRKMYSSIGELICSSAIQFENCIAYIFNANGVLCQKTYNDFKTDTFKFAAALGDIKYQNIALIGSSSYEWLVAYFGIIIAGKVVIPIEKDLDHTTIRERLMQVDSRCIICDHDFKRDFQPVSSQYIEIYGLNDYDKKNSNYTVKLDDVKRGANEVCCIIFSSGTSGEVKAVSLSERNIITDVYYLAMTIEIDDNSRVLSVLPFTHMLELSTSIMCAIYLGATVFINGSLRDLKVNFRHFHPTIIVVVPAYINMFYKDIASKYNSKLKKWILCKKQKLFKLANLLNIDIGNIIFKDIYRLFGGSLRVLVCGGAELDESKIAFFQDVGITILQGYGMTECAPVVSTNTIKFNRLGSVGRPLPCSIVKIENGEIFIRGDNVMLGYYNDTKSTNDVLKDGWLSTGDLGFLDKDGYLYVTGRKKNIIILENGENVSAEEIEKRLKTACEQIIDVIVFAENNYINAEIYYGENNPQVESNIINAVNRITYDWPRYKRIQRIVFRYEPFDYTALSKLKRM